MEIFLLIIIGFMIAVIGININIVLDNQQEIARAIECLSKNQMILREIMNNNQEILENNFKILENEIKLLQEEKEK